jgi:hypothetical protein
MARADAFDEELDVYLARFDNEALATAAQADVDFSAGIDRGPLQSIPPDPGDGLDRSVMVARALDLSRTQARPAAIRRQ